MDSETSGRDLRKLSRLLLARDRLSCRKLPGVLSRFWYVVLVLARKLRLSLAAAFLGATIADNLRVGLGLTIADNLRAFEEGFLRDKDGLPLLPTGGLAESALAAAAAAPVMIPVTDVARRIGNRLLPIDVFALSGPPTS